MKDQDGWTLIELVVSMLVVAIMGAVFSGAIIFFVQMFLYGPRQLNTQQIAQELDNLVIEGVPDVRGIRYAGSTGIIDASAAQFSYTYGSVSAPAGAAYDNLSVRLRWNAGNKHLYRSINSGAGWSAESQIPVFTAADISIDGKAGAGIIFQYKKDNDADWASGTDPLSAIRRVILNVTVNTGSGGFSESEGTFDLTTGAAIKSF